MSGDVPCPKESKITFKEVLPSVQGGLPAHICVAEPFLPFYRSANRLRSSAANTARERI